jgi:hypothetical protein
MRSMLVWLMVLSGGLFVAVKADAAPCRTAELFATDRTAVSTEPDTAPDGLQPFAAQAGRTLADSGEAVTGSTPLVGVSWSLALQRVTYERSREFHVCGPGEPTLHAAADALRRRFHQDAVLTFEYLPRQQPGAGAVLITVPGVGVAQFRDALVADPVAHTQLPDGSITDDHTLILVADDGDLDAARRLVGEAGGNWNAARVASGRREVVASQS